MDIASKEIEKMIDEIDDIRHHIQGTEILFREQIDKVHPKLRKSAANLVHYNALRELDIRSLQHRLGELNISRLAKAEPHVDSSLSNIRHLLGLLIGKKEPQEKNDAMPRKKALKVLRSHTKTLFGNRSPQRRVRIMVTLPTTAAFDEKMVDRMVSQGMNCARINCAHDDEQHWLKMIENVKKAAKQHHRKVKICMDLGGPKIRTGRMAQGPKVKKFKPQRDSMGRVLQPACIELRAPTHELMKNQVPVPKDGLSQLHMEDSIELVDTRGEKRQLIVTQVAEEQVQVTCPNTCYLATGMKLHLPSGKEAVIGDLPSLQEYITVHRSDLLELHKKDIIGHTLVKGHSMPSALHKISCTLPEVFQYIKNGERILFDDGKIEGIIVSVQEEIITVEITHADSRGSKLKADKGINLPDSSLSISGLTAKDRKDLRFIASHADNVNFSFVNSPEDVEELMTEIERHGASQRLGIVLKIETQSAFDNLTKILLSAMRSYPVGVMIARGDLAIETGWGHIAMVQNEILALCNAAQVPVIWATQVLDNLAKKGIPSRSEITDAATAIRAECVMLNKGPYISRAILLLDSILKDMESYQEKNVRMLPILEKKGR